MEETKDEGVENPLISRSNAPSKEPSFSNNGVPSSDLTPCTPRFCVNQVKLDPKPTKVYGGEEDKTQSRRTSFLEPSPSRPLSMVDVMNTIGYATHDAVPMTIFYRNDASQSDVAKARPTLRELRKGFEEDHEQQVCNVLSGFGFYFRQNDNYSTCMLDCTFWTGLRTIRIFYFFCH